MSSRVGSSAVLLVFVLPWMGLTGAFDYFMVSGMVRQARASGWPTVQGTIRQSELEAVHKNKGTTYGFKVAYTYVVDGQPYEGHKYRDTMSRSGDPRSAKRLVARYPVGATVPVHYAPDKPSEALLQAGIDGADLLHLMILLPFNLVALFLCSLVFMARTPPHLPTFTREDGSECVTLGGLPPFFTVLLALGGAGLACLVLVALTAGIYPSLFVGVAAWGAVLACGVYAGRWSSARKKAGHYDLRLHARERSLSLPPVAGRKQRLDLRWRDVRSLGVEADTRQQRGKTVTSYRPLLELSAADGSVRREVITRHVSQEQAEALVRWLRTHIHVGETVPEERRSA